jgi:chitin synthase
MYTSLVVIVMVILIRFGLAIYFNWTMSRRLGKVLPPPPDDDDVATDSFAALRNKRSSIMVPRHGRYSQASFGSGRPLSMNHRQTSSNSLHYRQSGMPTRQRGSVSSSASSSQGSLSTSSSLENLEDLDGILRTIMLVTCYSEGEAGLRSTLDSLARTNFPDSHKILFVVADGIITGAVRLSLLDID